MLTVIIYAAYEYPEFINFETESDSFNVNDMYNATYQTTSKNSAININGLLKVIFNTEIIAVTDGKATLWVNPTWTDSSFTKETLLPNWPLK